MNQQESIWAQTAVSMGFLSPKTIDTYEHLHEKNLVQLDLGSWLVEKKYMTLEQWNEVITNSDLNTGSFESDTLGRYELLEELGRGGMGKVYKAYDPKNKQTVALKVLLRDGNDTQADDIERFMREIKAMASLNHPNIIRLFEVHQEGLDYFFTMEYIKGETLKEYIKKTSLTIRQATEIVIKVAKAMHCAHQINIIHRDLKTENIMLDAKKEPKLMDFGLAKSTLDKKLSQTGMLLGTVQYMPPEQAEGKLKEIDQRSDVYALGSILYELITNNPPFVGKSFHEILEQIISKEPIPPSHVKRIVPLPLEHICLKALAKKKIDRYQSALGLAEDLEAFLQKKNIQAHPPSFVKRLKKSVEKNKSFTSIILGVVAILPLLFLGTYLATSKSNKMPSSFLKIWVKLVAKQQKQNVVRPDSPVKVEVVWEGNFSGKEKIKIFGKGIKSSKYKCSQNNKGKRKRLCDLKLLKKQGVFKLVVEVHAGKLKKSKSISFKIPVVEEIVKDMFRGNSAHTGVYQSSRVLSNRCIWRYNVARPINTSPVVVDNVVYFGSNSAHLYALNALNGVFKWKFKVSGAVYATPIVTPKRLYFASLGGIFYVLNKKGTLKWQYKVKKSISSSPVLLEDKVIFGSRDFYIYALKRTTGKLMWKFKTEGKIDSSCAVADNTIYFGSYDRHIYALDPHGVLKWKHKTGGVIDSSPSVMENSLYIGSADGYFYALNRHTGKLIWRYKAKKRIISVAAVTKDSVYFACMGGYLYALRRKDGQLRWSYFTLKGVPLRIRRIIGGIRSSPAIADGTIYFGCRDTYFYCLDIKTGKRLWRFKTARPLWSSPAVANGIAYIGGNDGFFYAVK